MQPTIHSVMEMVGNITINYNSLEGVFTVTSPNMAHPEHKPRVYTGIGITVEAAVVDMWRMMKLMNEPITEGGPRL